MSDFTARGRRSLYAMKTDLKHSLKYLNIVYIIMLYMDIV